MIDMHQLTKEIVEGKSSLSGFVIRDDSMFSKDKNMYIKNMEIAIKNIYAENLYIIESKVKADIHANKVYILDNSDITGDIESEIIKIEDGCIFNGSRIIK